MWLLDAIFAVTLAAVILGSIGLVAKYRRGSLSGTAKGAPGSAEQARAAAPLPKSPRSRPQGTVSSEETMEREARTPPPGRSRPGPAGQLGPLLTLGPARASDLSSASAARRDPGSPAGSPEAAASAGPVPQVEPSPILPEPEPEPEPPESPPTLAEPGPSEPSPTPAEPQAPEPPPTLAEPRPPEPPWPDDVPGRPRSHEPFSWDQSW
jgi:hypothetical protein